MGSAAGGRRRGRSASERGGRVDKSNPGCSWRGSGNSRTFGRLTCHAAGLLGDGALGHRVEAAGQRGRGAENTGHGLAAEDRSRECDPRGAKYPGSRGLKPDSRVQGSIARLLDTPPPLALPNHAGDRINPHGKIPLSRCVQTVLLEPSLLDTPGDSIRS